MSAPTPPDEDTFETIVARVNFFESSVDQIKREFPKYLQHLADTERSHGSLSKVLKSVASAEPNTVLQYIMLLYAQKEESLAKEQVLYRERVHELKEMLDTWSKLIITPIREVIADHNFQMRSAMPISEAGSRPASPAGHEIPPPPNSSAGVPGSPQIRERKPPAVQATLKTLLPVHMKLFEKHRLVEMKKLLRNMIMNDVQYHAKALEAYSQLMECIHEADERDSNQPL